MKVLAFNGSPNPTGNTYGALALVGAELQHAGIDFEIIQIGNKLIRGCLACGGCAKNQNERCVIIGDELNDYFQRAKVADGILLGSPVHFSGVAGTMKSFLDRLFYVSTVNNGMFRHKIGATVVAVRTLRRCISLFVSRVALVIRPNGVALKDKSTPHSGVRKTCCFRPASPRWP